MTVACITAATVGSIAFTATTANDTATVKLISLFSVKCDVKNVQAKMRKDCQKFFKFKNFHLCRFFLFRVLHLFESRFSV